jgi:NTP pyrophosphatase (non-canonical NTP hydrolase)
MELIKEAPGILLDEPLKEAFDFINQAFEKNPQDLQVFLSTPISKMDGRFHFTLGAFLRNSLSLWDIESKTAAYLCEKYGLWHGDDLSGLLMQLYWQWKNNQIMDVSDLVERYLDHWKNYVSNTSSALQSLEEMKEDYIKGCKVLKIEHKAKKHLPCGMCVFRENGKMICNSPETLCEDEEAACNRLISIVSPKRIHQNAINKGFVAEGERRLIDTHVSLLHSEVSELYEGHRNKIPLGQKGGIDEELADLIIRAFDMAAEFDIDIAEVVRKKHQHNLTRPYKHGKVC